MRLVASPLLWWHGAAPAPRCLTPFSPRCAALSLLVSKPTVSTDRDPHEAFATFAFSTGFYIALLAPRTPFAPMLILVLQSLRDFSATRLFDAMDSRPDHLQAPRIPSCRRSTPQVGSCTYRAPPQFAQSALPPGPHWIIVAAEHPHVRRFRSTQA